MSTEKCAGPTGHKDPAHLPAPSTSRPTVGMHQGELNKFSFSIPLAVQASSLATSPRPPSSKVVNADGYSMPPTSSYPPTVEQPLDRTAQKRTPPPSVEQPSDGAAQERTLLQFALPSDDPIIPPPNKKVKKILTTRSAKSTTEVEDLRALRMLQLARASRNAFAAHLRYHRLRMKELDIMRAITVDECEEAEAFLKKADRQIGEIKHTLDREGIGLLEQSSLAVFEPVGREPSGSDEDACPSDSISSSVTSHSCSGSNY